MTSVNPVPKRRRGRYLGRRRNAYEYRDDKILQWARILQQGFDVFNMPECPITWYRELRDKHVSALESPRYKNLCDIGAGTGNATIAALELDGDKRKELVYATDKSRGALKILRRKCKKQGIDYRGRLATKQVSALKLDFPDEIFDGMIHMLLVNFLTADDKYEIISKDDAARYRRMRIEQIREHIGRLYDMLTYDGGRLTMSGPKRSWNAGAMLDPMSRELEDWIADDPDRRVVNTGTVKDPVLKDCRYGVWTPAFEHFGKHLVSCDSIESIVNLDPGEVRELFKHAGFRGIKDSEAGYGEDWFIQGDKPRKPRSSGSRRRVGFGRFKVAI
ncbi:class I SAM-dependent methyltransferase [Candidatus Aenigmatarchaeota archaeon]